MLFFATALPHPFSMRILSYLFQEKRPQDGILVAKYVGLDICTITFHYLAHSTPLDHSLASSLFLPRHSHTPSHAIILVLFSSTESARRHTCSKVCWAGKSAPSLISTTHPPHPLITAQIHIFLPKHCHTLNHANMSSLLQAQKPQNGMLVAKYVKLENMRHHNPLQNTLHTP